MNVKQRLIKMGSEHPDLQDHIASVLDTITDREARGGQSFDLDVFLDLLLEDRFPRVYDGRNFETNIDYCRDDEFQATISKFDSRSTLSDVNYIDLMGFKSRDEVEVSCSVYKNLGQDQETMTFSRDRFEKKCGR